MKRVWLLMIALPILCFGYGEEAFALEPMTLGDANAACTKHGGYQPVGNGFGCAWCTPTHCFVITCATLTSGCTFTTLPPSIKSVGSPTIGNQKLAPPPLPKGGKPENAAPIGKPVEKAN